MMTSSFSSAGRASVLWAEGRGFEPHIEYMVLSTIWKLLRPKQDEKGSPKQRLKKVFIIVWLFNIGSIPIYDYSLGVRVHPPLYITGWNR